MKVIGLTGGIGVGKGEVASILRSLGAVVLDADLEGHRIYRKGTEGWRRVVALFGRQILNKAEEVDRQRLGQLVFADPVALERLNAALHPLIREVVSEQLRHWELEGGEVAVVEAALLLEAKWHDLVDEVWVVWTLPEVVVSRLKEHRGFDEVEVRRRVHAQAPYDWKMQQAQVSIENVGTLEELRRKVTALWQERVKGKG